MIISLSISTLIGIFTFLFGGFGEIEAKILLTALAMRGYSLIGLCCSTLYKQKRVMPLASLGIVLSVLGFLYTVSFIWEMIDIVSWDSFKLVLIFIILALSLAHSCLLFLIKVEKPAIKIALFTTI
ncbi:MAG: hypothetical protein GF390_02880 [Candidatus Pacebacteria bacterium]|nr:hypothetical protein [Candidatus Paceibacterota bacterium]